MILTRSISFYVICRDIDAELGWAAMRELFVLKQLSGEIVTQAVAREGGWWPLVGLQLWDLVVCTSVLLPVPQESQPDNESSDLGIKPQYWNPAQSRLWILLDLLVEQNTLAQSKCKMLLFLFCRATPYPYRVLPHMVWFQQSKGTACTAVANQTVSF